MTTLAHSTDPDTSHEAAASLNKQDVAVMKQAILYLLVHCPDTAWNTTNRYFRYRESFHWPFAKRDSIAKRMSELHRDGLIRRTDQRRATGYGRMAVVMEVVK